MPEEIDPTVAPAAAPVTEAPTATPTTEATPTEMPVQQPGMTEEAPAEGGEEAPAVEEQPQA